jgi:hypothetical protein
MTNQQKFIQSLLVPIIWLLCLYFLLQEGSVLVSIIWGIFGIWYITKGVKYNWKKLLDEHEYY